MKVNYGALATALIFTFLQTAHGQTMISGTVYARKDGTPLRGVSILTVSGKGTATDSLGHYSIPVAFNDSIYFSWLGKVTERFAVKDLKAGEPFDLNLDEVNVHYLPAISVNGPRDYQQDSLKNREQYQKVFGYDAKSGLQDKNLNQLGGFGLGWDLNNMISPSANAHKEALQEKLTENERDKYIDHKFNRSLVKRISGLEPPALDSFMKAYRPSVEDLQKFETDYEYYQWISTSAKIFKEDLIRAYTISLYSLCSFAWY